MSVRRMSWGEYSAWLAVTGRAERERRRRFVCDVAIGLSGGESLEKHLEKLAHGH